MHAKVEIVAMDKHQFAEAGHVLARAFFDDPWFRYILPNSAARRGKLPVFMEAGCRLGHQIGHAYTTAGRVGGAALWVPPGEADLTPDRLEAAGFAHVAEVWGEAAMGRFAASMAHLEALHHRDMPAPHWYLFGMGVDPPLQGQGVGGQLLQPILGRADGAGQACYLETQKARNVPFYQRHGFEMVAETDVPGGGPHFWTMRRHPRPLP